MPFENTYDCIVLGGGPAGSSVAALVAESGCSVLLLEREKMPRFHVGESLMPETYWIFERLGVLDKMRQSDFVKKASVQFVSSSGAESQPFFFEKHDSRECSQTWQVERSRFDQMLWENAAEKGANCHDATRVLEVLFDGDREDSENLSGLRARGVRLQTSTGETKEINARVVVDATGQQSLIANALGIRRVNPDLKKSAIWNYFRGARREPGLHGGATIILNTQSRESWFWYIPLSQDITSVGVVSDTDRLFQGAEKPEQLFQRELDDCSAVANRLANASPTDKFRVAREFSYSVETPVGEGWVLVGDAWGFIDPIYSSGVYFALKSGELAADCIVQALRENDPSAEKLGAWIAPFSEATDWVRRLVTAFYSDRFSFGRFMKQHPEHLGNLTNLLIGRIFDPEVGAIFQDMDRWLAANAEKE